MVEDSASFERRGAAGDRLCSPSAARNAGPITEALRSVLAPSARVLEIASGTGEHGVRIVQGLPGLTWQPSDPDPASRRSQAAWASALPAAAIRPPLALDVTQDGWWQAAGGPYDALFCANMVHIAPWAAAEGLMRGAAALLAQGGPGPEPTGTLALYGPFSRRGAMADSNASFHASLRARDPAWGLRDLDDQVQPVAARFGLALTSIREMPTNNLFVTFER